MAREDSGAQVVVAGELDMSSSQSLDDCLNALISEGTLGVELDLSDVGFIDSSGVRIIARAHKRLEKAGGSLRVSAASPSVRKVLEVTGLSRYLDRP